MSGKTRYLPEVYVLYMVTIKKHGCNSRTCIVVSSYRQTSVAKIGHLQVVPIHDN